VYFPRRVIPMLPEKLSNGLCSLNPQVERLCMVCRHGISATGEIKHYRFYPAVIWSQARLTYTQVAAALYEQGSGGARRAPRCCRTSRTSTSSSACCSRRAPSAARSTSRPPKRA
jgi:exoribonuclease R